MAGEAAIWASQRAIARCEALSSAIAEDRAPPMSLRSIGEAAIWARHSRALVIQRPSWLMKRVIYVSTTTLGSRSNSFIILKTQGLR